MTAALDAAPLHRQRCYRCLRPVVMCWCAELPVVPTRTQIVVLQHPHERQHPFGTARLVDLCLPNASVHTAYAGASGPLRCEPDVPPGAALLFPHPEAADLAELPAHERPTSLVLIDGTWSHAKRLYRENPWLQRLRPVRLHPQQPSRYRIRREPRDDYVSTLEAIVEALAILEPDTRTEALLAAFDRMIDQQIAHSTSVQRCGRRKLERDRPSRALSPLLADPRLVVIYAESSLPGGDVHAARELVQLVAARIATGETFEALLRPAAAMPSLHHLAHMGLAPDDVAAGKTPADARARFAAFAGDAPLAAWTQTSLDWSAPLLPPTRRTVLKTNYCNLKNRAAGLLEDVILREGLTAERAPCRGRAGERLGNALAAARWLLSIPVPPFMH